MFYPTSPCSLETWRMKDRVGYFDDLNNLFIEEQWADDVELKAMMDYSILCSVGLLQRPWWI